MLEEDVIGCAEAGVAGFVTLEGSLEDLEAILDSVGRGETLCSPRMVARAAATGCHAVQRSRRSARHRPDRARERQIVELVERGLSNKEIARELQIELPTVKNHVHHILEKMHGLLLV